MSHSLISLSQGRNDTERRRLSHESYQYPEADPGSHFLAAAPLDVLKCHTLKPGPESLA